MKKRSVPYVCAVSFGLIALAGCGGGGSPSLRQATIGRAVMAARTTRNTVAIASLSSRVGRALVGAPTRDHVPDHDSHTDLYYVVTTNPDGSALVTLWADAAHTVPAGTITIGAPQWTNGQPGAFPVTYHLTYNITVGSYAGNNGTADVTVNDPAGHLVLIHEALRNEMGETNDGNFEDHDGDLTGTDHCVGQNGSLDLNCMEDQNGDMQVDVDFHDGHHGHVVEHQDGSIDETMTGQHGEVEATENNDADGQGDIQFGDGEHNNGEHNNGDHNNEHVDVDVAQP